MVEVENLRFQDLLAAECQKLPRQRACPLTRFLNLLDIAAERSSRLQLLEVQVAVTDDRGEEVVEIMSDASSEFSHRFHLLRLPELFFKSLALGDGFNRAFVEKHVAAFIAD